MKKQIIVRKNEYHDSIRLLRVSEELRKMDGVEQVMVVMATPSNKQILENMGMFNEDVGSAGTNDMVIAVNATSEKKISDVIGQMDSLFKQGEIRKKDQRVHHSFESAHKAMPDANVALLSLPGEHALQQARLALDAGLHVIIYSDNIPLYEDRKIKEYARDKGLLCMGPDCGVTNINGVAFLTASVVRKGPIGIIGASGSGTQLISALIDKDGPGVSQAIGVGGKDLKDEVGGISMLMAIDALERDPETKVIVLVSRTPGPSTSTKILSRIKMMKKPVVVYFIDGDKSAIEKAGGITALDLEDAAMKAIDVFKGNTLKTKEFSVSSESIADIIEKEISGMNAKQKYLRGLYCGGTFCDEAISQVQKYIGGVYSNTSVPCEFRLEDSFQSKEHTIIDLGDEEFTLGRPHPVIDPEPVRLAIKREGTKDDTAVVLLDFILGPAINPDPVGSVIQQIKEIKQKKREKGGFLSVVASICGTDGDPQNLTRQSEILQESGVIVMPSNAQAARLAGLIAKRCQEKKRQ